MNITRILNKIEKFEYKNRKRYNDNFVENIKKIKKILNESQWDYIKKNFLISNFILKLTQNLEQIEHKSADKIHRRALGTYSTYYAENLIGIILDALLKNRYTNIEVIINGQVGDNKGPRPDLIICKKNERKERTILKKDILGIIEINTGVGWSRIEKVRDFNKKIKNVLLKKVVNEKKKIFIIFFDKPKNLDKLNLIKENIFIISDNRFHSNAKIVNPIEPLFEKILKIIKNDKKR
jgi:hypothetical protein